MQNCSNLTIEIRKQNYKNLSLKFVKQKFSKWKKRMHHFPMSQNKYVILCTIWYHVYNFNNVKNSHARVLLLEKLQAITLFFECFSRFLSSTNRTNSRRASHIEKRLQSNCIVKLCYPSIWDEFGKRYGNLEMNRVNGNDICLHNFLTL